MKAAGKLDSSLGPGCLDRVLIQSSQERAKVTLALFLSNRDERRGKCIPPHPIYNLCKELCKLTFKLTLKYMYVCVNRCPHVHIHNIYLLYITYRLNTELTAINTRSPGENQEAGRKILPKN